MKKNLLKRIGAVALALAVSLTMGTSAFAATQDTNQEGVGTSGTAISSMTIKKDIVLFNTASAAIYEPNITYNYTLSTQNPNDATVTDKNGMTATVKTGVAGLVTIQGTSGTAGTTAALQFGDDTSAASATNAEGSTVSTSSKVASRNITVNFDTTDVSPGIYRYKIEETSTSPAKNDAGVAEQSNYDKVRYLDVYVEWKDGSDHSKGTQVYGHVLYKVTDGTNNVNGESGFKYDSSKTTSVKVSGYDVASEMLGDTSTSDQYHTYNLKVTKTTTGTMADTSNEFPIAVSFANGTVKSKTDFYSTGDFANTALALDANGAYAVNADFSGEPAVKNGDTLSFIGLPAGTKFLVNEKNNASDSYKVTIKDATTGTDLFAEATVDPNANTTVTTATDLANAKGSAYETEDVQITNKLDSISPTNVVMRFAPYLFILGAAIVLLVMMRRRRASQDAE